MAEKWPKRESEVPDQPSIDNGKDFPGSHTPNGPKKETVPTTTAKDPKILVEEPMESTKQPKPPKESDEAEEKARKPKEGVEDKARKAKAEADREAERLRLQEQDAATLLQLAKSLIETDKDRAMRSLQNIVRQYPKTKAAAEAKKLLAIL